MGNMKLKPIQVRPEPEISDRVDKLVKKRVFASRAAVGETALETFVPLLETGVCAVINGKVVFLRQPELAA
jgi:hypothetical protein